MTISAISRRLLDDTRQYADGVSRDGGRITDVPWVRNLLADRYIESEVARLMAYNVAWIQGEGLVPNKEASMSKAFGSETLHRSANSVLEIVGLPGALGRNEERAPLKGRLPENWMISFSHKIAGGTSEVQRGIVASRDWDCRADNPKDWLRR